MKCDFCGSEKVVWRYRCTPKAIMVGEGRAVMVDDGKWAACDECSGMIETEDVMGVEERSLQRYVVEQGLEAAPAAMVKGVRGMLEMIHQTFWQSREGERELVRGLW